MCLCNGAVLCIQGLNHICVQQIPDARGNAVSCLKVIALDVSLNVIANGIFYAASSAEKESVFVCILHLLANFDFIIGFLTKNVKRNI